MSGRSVPRLPNSTLHLDATRRSPWLKHLRTFLAVAAGIMLIALLQWMIALPEPISSEPPAVSQSFDAVPNALQTAALAEVPVVRSTVEFPDDLQTLLNRGEYERLRQQLMRLAAGAAQQLDDQAMGNALTLLGVTALSENDTDSAAVYLQEALAIYEEIGDEVGGANANLQIGRLHVMERRRARRAALAYDTGLLARWKIANGQFSDAAPSLQRAIEENIELHRFG
ncbi:MAG: hypothetical protein KTR33_15765, partial [Gammaproteobacteria bacterium]|nr:hypothetical protein [Gammaproteobacteria bacterium]